MRFFEDGRLSHCLHIYSVHEVLVVLPTKNRVMLMYALLYSLFFTIAWCNLLLTIPPPTALHYW